MMRLRPAIRAAFRYQGPEPRAQAGLSKEETQLRPAPRLRSPELE